ncbi:Gfo/Idh/MocA family oxidoreductase [Campylobacter sp. CCUG 57310]|uniref:Gfo/Idh/MocA family oxidoreductase n=1 Tax=Campylobacter sp. CCUG 57310 TaxID=2517362 RepID=UPI001566B60B|nr:Gfo/Idh/MocA family oxidoreductase [Campylobacter sp. CCUG 57310]
MSIKKTDEIMKKRLAIIGFEDIGKMHYNELRRSDDFELVGIYSNKCGDNHARVEIYDDINELFEITNPEALIITDGIEYFNLFSKCVKASKFIFINAPLAKSSSAIQEMKYCSNLSGAVSAMCLCDRFNPVIASLKKSLEKEEKIYSINITCGICKDENLSMQMLYNIDLARYLTSSEVGGFFKFESKNDNKKEALSMLYELKMKNQSLVSIHGSKEYPINRFIVEVAAKSGIYFGDLLGLKLNKYTAEGQQNLKVNCDISPARMAQIEFGKLCELGKFENLASFDEVLKVYGVCA